MEFALDFGHEAGDECLHVYQLEGLILTFRDLRPTSDPSSHSEPILSSTYRHHIQPWRMNLVSCYESDLLFMAVGNRVLVVRISCDATDFMTEDVLSLQQFHRGNHSESQAETIQENNEPAEGPNALSGTEPNNSDEEELMINTIKVGFVNNQHYLVALDNRGWSHFWPILRRENELSSVDRNGYFFRHIGKSAWSICFAGSKMFIGTNDHCVKMLKFTSIGDDEALPTVRSHNHNVPDVDCDGEHLISVSIDGTCCISSAPDDGKADDSKVISRSEWCWACKIINVDREIVKEGILSLPNSHLNRRIQPLERNFYKGNSQTLQREGERDMPQDDEAHSLEEGHEQLIQDLSEQSSEPVEFFTEHLLGVPLWDGWDNEDRASDSYARAEGQLVEEYSDDGNAADEQVGTLTTAEAWGEELASSSVLSTEEDSSAESDTAYLQRVRRQGNSHIDNHNSPNFSIGTSEQLLDEHPRLVMHPDAISESESDTAEEASRTFDLHGNKIVAFTTNHLLILADAQTGDIIFEAEPSSLFRCYHPIYRNFIHFAFTQFNRLDMMQWIPELSSLFIANQNGHLYMIKLVRMHSLPPEEQQKSLKRIRITGCCITSTPTAPIAGFSVYRAPTNHPMIPLNPVRWILFILHLDGTHLVVEIDERHGKSILDYNHLPAHCTAH